MPLQLSVFRGELTVTPDQIEENAAHVAEEHGAIVGFYILKTLGRGAVELEHLFVDPAQLKRRVGSQLFAHACETARAAGAEKLVIQSDPNASGFSPS